MKKAIVINGSPNMDKGNTALILTPFIEGLIQAGAEVDVFYTRKLKIKPCLGELDCLFKTPGKCLIKDDMDILMPKLAESDIMVLATPVYADGMTGALKIFIERMIPAISPFIEIIDGHSRHPSGRPGKKALLVLVANCGLYEMDNFDPLLAYMQALSRSMSAEFAGALLRPHGPFLKPMLDMGMPVQDVLEAAKLVGCQLVETGKISSETLDTISRPLLPLQMYIQLFNQHVQQMMPA